MNLEQRLNQKIRSLRNQELFHFNPFIRPNDLSLHLEKSLRRLRITEVENYLLHGYPQHINLDYFAEALIELQRQGKAKSIGISYSGDFILEQSWIDVIQVPLASLPTVIECKSKIMIFSSSPASSRDWPSNKISLNDLSRVESVIVRSQNLTHIKENLDRISNIK